MRDRVDILLTGASGYIGGTVLTTLLTHFPASWITILLRPTTSLKPFKSLIQSGVKIIISQHSLPSSTAQEAEDEIRFLARDFGVVVHEGDAGNVPWVKGIIGGLEDRAALVLKEEAKVDRMGKGRRPIFMYGGGTGNMCDDSKGEFLQEEAWKDVKDISKWENSVGAFHREGDLLTVEASKRGFIDVIHVSPGLVFGTGTGMVTTISSQVPKLVGLALERGKAIYVGKGLGVWSPIHVEDVASAFLFLLRHHLDPNYTPPRITTGWETLHTIDTPELLNFKQISQNIGKTLYKLGRISSADAESVEYQGGDTGICANARTVGERIRGLGWTPGKGSLAATLEGDILHILES